MQLVQGRHCRNRLLRVSRRFQVNKLIRCNILSMDAMTRLVLPQMAERKKGAVINISSLSGAMCTPLLSVYSGTKAYVDK